MRGPVPQTCWAERNKDVSFLMAKDSASSVQEVLPNVFSNWTWPFEQKGRSRQSNKVRNLIHMVLPPTKIGDCSWSWETRWENSIKIVGIVFPAQIYLLVVLYSFQWYLCVVYLKVPIQNIIAYCRIKKEPLSKRSSIGYFHNGKWNWTNYLKMSLPI